MVANAASLSRCRGADAQRSIRGDKQHIYPFADAHLDSTGPLATLVLSASEQPSSPRRNAQLLTMCVRVDQVT